MNYNGKTKQQLINEALTAFQVFNDINTSLQVKEDIKQAYFESYRAKHVIYYQYDYSLDEIKLIPSLQNMTNLNDLKVA